MTSTLPSDTNPIKTQSLTIAAMGGAWLLTILQIQKQWQLNPQYAYGWLTIPLAIFLLWRGSNQNCLPQNPKPKYQNLLHCVSIFCVLSYLPLWLIQESSPDWRLLNWLIFLPAVTLTCIWFYNTGGIEDLKSLIFPLLFIATSIPWLLSWDLKIATYLQQKVTHFVLDTILISGKYAEIEGTLIRLSKCTVGVDEACSGIRGLQSSFVVALFLGQYLHLTLLIRAILLFASLIFAFLLNLFRAAFLAHLSASKGTDMASRWHDPIGILESAGTLVLLLLMLFVLIKYFNVSSKPKFDDSTYGSFNFLKRPFPKSIGYLSIIWFPLTIVLTSFWFRIQESNIPQSPKVSVDFQLHTIKYNKQRVSDAIRTQLNYSEALSGTWTSANFVDFIGFYCRWDKGGGSPLALAVHTPEVCLQLRGYRLIKKHEDVFINFPDINITVPFEAYTFLYQNEMVHIYRCYWPDLLLDGKFPGFPRQGYSTSGRIQATLRGYRNPGAMMVAIGVFQTPTINSFEIATEFIKDELNKKIHNSI